MRRFLQIFKVPDLRKKVIALALLLVVFRIFAAIPIPDIDTARLKEFFGSNELLGFLNVFSGGGLSGLSVVMLGVGPYITGSIIMQLLTIIFPNLKKIYNEEGAEGRAKFNRYSRYLTVPLAILQGYGFLNLLLSQGVILPMAFPTLFANVIVITAGSVLVMWLGELMSEYKMGNGISLIIFAGIVSAVPQTIYASMLNYTPSVLPTYIAFMILAVVVVAGIVFISEGERKIPVSYAKQVRGNKMYGGAASYLPLRVNQAGVIPIIFALSVILFPQFLAQTLAVVSPDLAIQMTSAVNKFAGNLLLFSIAYFILVVLFTFFYTAITFDPGEISKNLQKHGGFVPGIRPGEHTRLFISKIVYRITLFGAFFLGLIAILPNVTQAITGIQTLTLGGTAILIVVAVGIEIMKQIESQLDMREYENV
ncbi:MAG: preprotein translocase subunit SecY [Nanoarchaeota archaeon]|nr:preprotein translocase subunit SecY [Nanoarchaeota archaeon]